MLQKHAPGAYKGFLRFENKFGWLTEYSRPNLIYTKPWNVKHKKFMTWHKDETWRWFYQGDVIHDRRLKRDLPYERGIRIGVEGDLTIGFTGRNGRWEGPITRFYSTGDVHEFNYKRGLKCGESVYTYYTESEEIKPMVKRL